MPEELPHLILCATGPLSVDLAVRAWLRRCQGGLACLTIDCIGQQQADRAEITGSREGEGEDSMRIGCQSPLSASVEPLGGKGHPEPQSSSARLARMLGKRLRPGGTIGPESQEELAF